MEASFLSIQLVIFAPNFNNLFLCRKANSLQLNPKIKQLQRKISTSVNDNVDSSATKSVESVLEEDSDLDVQDKNVPNSVASSEVSVDLDKKFSSNDNITFETAVNNPELEERVLQHEIEETLQRNTDVVLFDDETASNKNALNVVDKNDLNVATIDTCSATKPSTAEIVISIPSNDPTSTMHEKINVNEVTDSSNVAEDDRLVMVDQNFHVAVSSVPKQTVDVKNEESDDDFVDVMDENITETEVDITERLVEEKASIEQRYNTC